VAQNTVGGEGTTCASIASSLNLRRATARRPLTRSECYEVPALLLLQPMQVCQQVGRPDSTKSECDSNMARLAPIHYYIHASLILPLNKYCTFACQVVLYVYCTVLYVCMPSELASSDICDTHMPFTLPTNVLLFHYGRIQSCIMSCPVCLLSPLVRSCPVHSLLPPCSEHRPPPPREPLLPK
jgi:hypothetical protein